jgi:PAS domain S-box-containing protein
MAVSSPRNIPAGRVPSRRRSAAEPSTQPSLTPEEADAPVQPDFATMLPERVPEAFIAGPDGRILHASPALLDTLGYTHAEACRMTIAFLDATLTRSRWQHLVTTMRGQPDGLAFESALQSKTGALQPRKLEMTRWEDASGEFIVCQAAATDIGIAGRTPARVRAAVPTRVGRSGEAASPTGSSAPASDPRLRALIDTMEDAVVLTDARGLITAANAAAETMFNVRNGDLAGRLCTDPRLRLVDTDGDPLALSAHPIMAALVTERTMRDCGVGMLRTDGGTRPLLMNAAPVRDANGALTGALGSLRDAPVRERTVKGSAPAALLREVVEVCLSARSENELEKRVCETLAEVGDYALVWRGITKSTDQKVHVSCSAGVAREYLRTIRFRFDDSELGNGPVGHALRSGVLQVVPDVRGDERCAPWQEQTVKAGLLSMAVVPLVRSGVTHGVLVLHAREAHRFDDLDTAILTDVAALVAMVLAELRLRTAEAELARRCGVQARTHEALVSELPAAHALFSVDAPYECLASGGRMNALFDEPFRSRGIVGQALPDFQYACYCPGLADAVSACAAGEGPVRRTDDLLRDWEGRESGWDWAVRSIAVGDEPEAVLFVAWPHAPRHES